MPLTGAERQKAHRDRKAERSLRMEGALAAILKAVEPRKGPVADAVRKIAEEGLRL